MRASILKALDTKQETLFDPTRDNIFSLKRFLGKRLLST